MNYEKTNWQPGDTITSAKLNNLEGGVESSSTLLENAMNIGGIAYQSPDELITHIAEEGTTISPAIVVLEDYVNYTFKFVDDVHPDGVTLATRAYEEEDSVVWQPEKHSNCKYRVTYDPQTNTNTFSAFMRNKDVEEPMASDVYVPGAVHRISSDAVAPAPATIDIIQSSVSEYHCEYSAQELLDYVLNHHVTVRLIRNYQVADSIIQEVYIASAVIGKWLREFTFGGVDVFFDRFDGSTNAWRNFKITFATDGTISGTVYNKTITAS